MGDDPAASNLNLKALLDGLEFLVVQDIFMTETARIADVVLPAASWVEKTGTFTNLERRLQQIRSAEEPVAESRPDWEIIQALAKKMGGSLHYGSARDIMNEIRSTTPLYADLAPGSIWPQEKSPLAGADADLSLSSDVINKKEVIAAERLPVLVRHDDHALEGNRDHTAQLLSPPLPRRGEEVKVRVNLRSGRG